MQLVPYPALGLADARKKALAAQAEVAAGRDPADESKRRRNDISVEEFAREHFVPHQQASKRSWEGDVLMLDSRILPMLGRRRLRDMSRHDAVQLLNSVAAVRSQTTANRHFTCLARMLNLAQQWGFVAENVARGVKKVREQPRKERTLSPEEVRRLHVALRADQNQLHAGAIRLLLWTGVRRGEALGLLWEDVTLQGEAPSLYLRLTKSGRPRTVPLNTAAVETLRELAARRRKDEPKVFPADTKVGRVLSLKSTWERAKKACGLEHTVRLHDLRHSFASSLAQNGTRLYVIQKLLGHERPIMTQHPPGTVPKNPLMAKEWGLFPGVMIQAMGVAETDFVNIKAPMIGIFDFRAFLNLAMLMVESERARRLRQAILDIVNQPTGGGTKYINQRDEDLLHSWFAEGNEWVAVGMPVSRHPPHRSVREELPHTAPTSGQTQRR